MAGRLSDETTKLHIHLFTEDVEFIDEMMCRQGMRTVGRSRAIRMMIHGVVQHMKRNANAKPVPFDESLTDLINE